MRLCDEVRSNAAAVMAKARSVSIDDAALDALSLDDDAPDDEPQREHRSEDEAAAYVLTLDAINFGSGWHPTLRKRRGLSGHGTVAAGVAERFAADGPWTSAELRAIRADEIAEVLGQAADHELMALFAQALRQLGTWLGDRSPSAVVGEARGSAERLAETLAIGMATFGADRGFFKRAQIAASDLAHEGVARFGDLARLTVFADNVVPHVLRVDGAIVLDPRLAAHIDAGRLLRPGPQERELRAAAVVAGERIARRVGATEREVDLALWRRGRGPAYKAIARPRCRTVFY